jgi:hypothetical protein
MIVNGTNTLRNCSARNTSRVELYYEENSGSDKFKKIILVRIHVIYEDVKNHIQSSYFDQANWVIVKIVLRNSIRRLTEQISLSFCFI